MASDAISASGAEIVVIATISAKLSAGATRVIAWVAGNFIANRDDLPSAAPASPSSSGSV